MVTSPLRQRMQRCSPVSESCSLVAIEALKSLFPTPPHHHPPASESYFPQEARGFVQLNSSPHPRPSLKYVPRPASPLRALLEFPVGGMRYRVLWVRPLSSERHATLGSTTASHEPTMAFFAGVACA
jgi:hypothetical protein